MTSNNPKTNKDAWGTFDYKRVHTLTGPVSRELVDMMNLMTSLDEPGTRILELGCGNGALTQTLSEAYPSASILSTDYSDGMVASTAALNLPNVTTRQLDAMDLSPVSGQPFTCIASTATLQFCPDPKQPVREAYRLLQHSRSQHPEIKQDSFLLGITTWNASETERMVRETGRELGLAAEIDLLAASKWPQDVAGVQAELEAAGFRDVRTRQIHIPDIARESIEQRLEHLWEWPNPALTRARELFREAGFSKEVCVETSRRLYEEGEVGKGRFGNSFRETSIGCIVAVGRV